MAVDAVRHGSRRRRESARAAKARRDKIIVAVGGAILVLLLVWQGPKTLKQLQGRHPAAASTPAVGSPAVPATAPAKPVDLKQFDGYAAKDPFAPQVVTGPSTPSDVVTVRPPHVRTSNFVPKDPFVQQLTLTSGNPSAPVTAGTGGRGSYIVVIASLPVSGGRSSAFRAAADARKHGVSEVKIVVSSKYATLRSGFYAVYSGPYQSLADALTAVAAVRGQGYVSAYTRKIAS